VLEEAAIDARFAQRRGPRMAPRVHRSALVEAAGPQGGAQGIRHAVAQQGCRGRRHPKTATARRWNKPYGVAVGFPVLAEQCEGLLEQRHLAVLRPFAVAHVDDHPGTLKIGHLEVGAVLRAGDLW